MSGNKGEKQTFQTDAVLFDLIILAFFLLFAIMSLEYNPRARSIPFGLGILGSIMTFLQFLVDALPGVRSKLRFVGSSGLLADKNQFRPRGTGEPGAPAPEKPDQTGPSLEEKQKSGTVEWWRVFRIILWLVGFIVLLAYINYLIAVGAFVVLVTRLEAKESWKRSILLGFCIDLGFFLLFEVLLQAQL
jgi:hypothetical protein